MGRVAWGRGGSWLGGLAAALGEQGGWSGASVLVVLGMRAVVLASSLVWGEEKGGRGLVCHGYRL